MFEHRLSYYKVTIDYHVQIDRFFQYLDDHQVTITFITSTEKSVSFFIKRKDLKIVRKGRRKFRLKMKVEHANQNRLLPMTKGTLIGLLFFVIVPIILSSFLWNITIINDKPEVSDGIHDLLKRDFKMSNIMPLYKLPPHYEIRQRILKQYPEISWVFLQRVGGKLTLEVQYAPEMDEPLKEEQLGHLIAKASGVITHWDIKKGEKLVVKNQTVYKGDLLVTGHIQFEDNFETVGAEGQVFADYWLETNFTIPKKIESHHIELIGWEIKGFSLPEIFYPLKDWFSAFVKLEKVTKTTTHEIVITEDNIHSTVLPLLEHKFLENAPKNTKIKSQKLLHLELLDDTVKGKILFLINENIAELQPIE